MIVSAFETSPAKPNMFELMVQSARESTFVQSVKEIAPAIPFRKHDAVGLKDRNGKPWVKYVPYDLERRYDEALFKAYDKRIRSGYMIPKLSANG